MFLLVCIFYCVVCVFYNNFLNTFITNRNIINFSSYFIRLQQTYFYDVYHCFLFDTSISLGKDFLINFDIYATMSKGFRASFFRWSYSTFGCWFEIDLKIEPAFEVWKCYRFFSHLWLDGDFFKIFAQLILRSTYVQRIVNGVSLRLSKFHHSLLLSR